MIKNKYSNFPTKYRLFSKGGAENVKTICKYYLDPETGLIKQLGDQHLTLIKDTIDKFNKQMLRSLYICYKDISKEEYDNVENSDNIDQYDLVFIAVFGIRGGRENKKRGRRKEKERGGSSVKMSESKSKCNNGYRR